MIKGAKAWLILVAVVAVSIGGCFYLADQPERSMAAKLPELKERGERFNIPHKPEDMDRFSPNLPPDESGTEALVAFGTAYERPETELGPIERAQAVHENIANDQELRTNLEAMLASRGFAYNRQWELGFKVLFPEYAHAKASVRALSSLALYEASQGNEEAAAERFQQALWVARETTYEQVLIAGLIRVAGVSLVTQDALLAALALDDPEASASLLRKVVSDIPTEKSFNHYLAGEVYNFESFRYLGDSKEFFNTMGSDSLRGVPVHWVFDAGNPTHVDALVARGLESLLPAMEAYEEDPLRAYKLMEELDRQNMDETSFMDLVDGSRLLARIMLPVYSRSLPAMQMIETQHDLMLVLAEAIETTGEVIPSALPAEARAATEMDVAYEPRPGGYAIAIDILGDGIQTDLRKFQPGDDRPPTDVVLIATLP